MTRINIPAVFLHISDVVQTDLKIPIANMNYTIDDFDSHWFQEEIPFFESPTSN
jgi:hypothetical protein